MRGHNTMEEGCHVQIVNAMCELALLRAFMTFPGLPCQAHRRLCKIWCKLKLRVTVSKGTALLRFALSTLEMDTKDSLLELVAEQLLFQTLLSLLMKGNFITREIELLKLHLVDSGHSVQGASRY
jgi:hypothetical protein